MAYATTLNFNPAVSTGVLSGTLSFVAPVTIPLTASQTVSDIVVTAYADGAQANGGASYFAQTRTDGNGNWSLSTNGLSAGPHTIAVTADYGSVLGTLPVTTTGGAIGDGSGARRGLLTNQAPRA